jgi:hypothetical protein
MSSITHVSTFVVMHKSSEISELWDTVAGMVMRGEEHVNTGRDTLSFCPTLQVLDMSTIGDAADVNLVTKILPQRSRAANASIILCRCCVKSRGIGGKYTRSLR